MRTLIRRFSRSQAGATAIEYGLIASVVSIVIVTAVALLGGTVRGKFEAVSSGVAAAGSGSGS